MDDRMVVQTVTTPSARTIGLATIVALLTALVVLFVAILPAEYGIDPLRTGRLLGLTSLADVRPGVIAAMPGDYKIDTIQFELRPFQSIEYKYQLENGASMVFSWRATGDVTYDMHSEPAGGPEGYAESFDKGRANQSHGTYTAPFAGIHGWFWENRTADAVTVQLTTAGFYTAAYEIGSTGRSPRTLTDIR
jgi:hypothetical protein